MISDVVLIKKGEVDRKAALRSWLWVEIDGGVVVDGRGAVDVQGNSSSFARLRNLDADCEQGLGASPSGGQARLIHKSFFSGDWASDWLHGHGTLALGSKGEGDRLPFYRSSGGTCSAPPLCQLY